MELKNDEKELLEKFRGLSPENRVHALSNLRVALDSQENTKKAMSAALNPAEGKRSA
ncbi:hypothetical protein AGMMS50268_04110 [Spirochaetia bacterium]|nr:hypothetical protein AGMMS50268_04110 [Spirochaetia bacterium]